MSTIIESHTNPKIKLLKKLQLKKYRQKLQQFTVENFKIIHDAVDSGFKPVSLFVSRSWVDRYPQDLDFLEKIGSPIFIITDQANASFSSLETPSGICAVYDIVQNKINLKAPIVYLDHVMDPGNLGTIIRCACAFDFETVVVADGVDPYNHKTISAAKDAIFKIAVILEEKQEVLAQIKKVMPLIGATLTGTTTLDDIDHPLACVVLGSEAHGISPHVIQELTCQIRIPMSSKMESLNVATAGAIMMYEQFRSR